jgi:ParB-like chromosome segregation protein Spo0J
MMTLTKHLSQPDTPETNIVIRQITSLKPNPKNARIHQPRQINLLAKSIQSFGFNVPVLIDAESNVLAGHGRLVAAQKLEIKEIPTISLAHLSAAQAKAFMIADNRLTEIATWDDNLLAIQLKELSLVNLDFDLEATGFTVGEIDLRIDSLDIADKSADDEIPVVSEGPAVTQQGDLWLLGEHRLLCGNAQQASAFEQLMDNQIAGMIIIDPPFNVKVQGHVGGKGKIKHREFGMASGEMSSAAFISFLTTTFELLVAHSKAGSVHSIFMDWRHLPEILAAGGAVYSSLLNLCVWVKHQAGMGSLYRSQHELVLIYKNGTASHQNNIQLGRFGRYRTNVWQYGGIQAMRHSEEGDLLSKHPTVKPVQMIADAILDCSTRNDIVLDSFLGSGTTLLACTRTGRRCYGMELDPLYVDTAIQRWQIMTGMDAVNAVTGETFIRQMQKQTEQVELKGQSIKQQPALEVHHD